MMQYLTPKKSIKVISDAQKRSESAQAVAELMFVKAAQAQQLLYAIVNTLCQLPDLGAVQILVEGEAPERYGEIPPSSPLEANKDLVVD